jgi:hypothetical protein
MRPDAILAVHGHRHPGFSQIHLHSRNTLRCGITLLQRSEPLARPGDESNRREHDSRSV